MRSFIILVAIAAIVSSCSPRGGPSAASLQLPPVERLRNTGSYSVQIDAATGLEGEYFVPLLDGPYPAVVLANDGVLSADQVKEEARMLARHGFAVLSVTLLPDDAIRQYARAGATVVGQPGAGTAEAALVLLSGDPGPAVEIHRRLAGYRLLVLVDPSAPPPLSEFVGMGDAIVVMTGESTLTEEMESWRDALSLVGARTAIRVVPQGGSETSYGAMSSTRRQILARTIVEFLQ